MSRIPLLVAILIIVLFICVEVAIRASGLVDVPTYLVDGGIGYIPKPDQSGAFLNKNSWVFNNRSMGVGQDWAPGGHDNVLLIGNSVVMGGDPYNQPEKLGPVIQRKLGSRVMIWPIAAGGWSNVNESVYLERNPDVVASANFFVWEYMAGGLARLTPWPGDYQWPRQHPLCATCYVMRHFVIPRLVSGVEGGLPQFGGAVDPAALARFTAAISRLSVATGRRPAGILFLYPIEANLDLARHGGEWLPERGEIETLAAQFHLRIVDVAQDPLWNDSLYRPDHVHPSVAGNAVLGGILARAIGEAYPTQTAAH